MRKLLLAGVAGLGAWGMAAADASAQTPAPSYSGGSVTTYSGGVALPTVTSPTPGTVVVRLNGRVRVYGYAGFDRDANTTYTAAATNGTLAAANAGSVGTAKLNDYGVAEYGRLYPGFDGIAANGLKYGANMEIRQDTNYAAGGGANGSPSANDPKRAELYFRRVWGYVGTDQLGTIRVGSIDQPTSLYLTGNFENFNDGGWNGDAPGFIAGSIAPAWPFADVGSYYTTSKVVYLSPQLFGFDLGVSYEPTTANVSGNVNCNVAGQSPSTYPGTTFANGTGCDALSSTPVNSESQRRRNTFDMLLRYRGSFGPVGVAATGAYVTGSHINDSGANAGFSNNPLGTGVNGAGVVGARYNYDGLSVGDFGATITVAGATVGGHYMEGRWNSYIGGTVPKGLPDGTAWVAGGSYTFGPMIVGAHYFVSETAGDLGNAFYGRQRLDQGLAVGGTYSVAPGFSLYLSGLWGERRQSGYDFITGAGVTTATGAAGTPTHNKVTSDVFSIGTAFSW